VPNQFSPERLVSLCKFGSLSIASIVRDCKKPANVNTYYRGEDVRKLFKYAQEKNFAIPAINVTSSISVVAVLEAARDAKSPIILQMSQGGAAYFAGKGVPNSNQEASIAGAVAGAQYIRAIAPVYGVPVVLHTDHCAKKLLPWLDGMMEADEVYFKEHGEPLFSSQYVWIQLTRDCVTNKT
jgi:fructose-bisphosphate aldolase class II